MATFGSGNFSSELSTLTLTSTDSWGSANAASEVSLLSGVASLRYPWAGTLIISPLEGVGKDFYGDATSELSILEGQGAGVPGATGTAETLLKYLTSVGSGERGWYGAGNLSMLTSVANIYLNITFDGALTLALVSGAATMQLSLTDTFQTWCLEARTNAHTKYDSFGFNSFGIFNGITLGANESGIYSLGGETDDGEDIEATYLHAVTNFEFPERSTDLRTIGLKAENASRKKRMSAAYLTLRDGGSVQLILKVDEDKYRVYDVDTTNDPEGMHLKIVRQLGRNLTGTFWQPGVCNVDGSDFEVESIKLYPVVLSRRV